MSTGQQTIQMGLFHLYKTFKRSSVTLVSNAGEREGGGAHILQEPGGGSGSRVIRRQVPSEVLI